MDCLNCSARSICKIYDAIQKYQYAANITITNCTVKPGVSSPAPAVSAAPPLQPIQQRSPEELINISQRIKELSKAKEESLVYVMCPDCGEETEASEMTSCTSCKKNICGSCKVIINGRIVCEDCYHAELDKSIEEELSKK